MRFGVVAGVVAGYMGAVGEVVGRWREPCFEQSRDVAKALSEMFLPRRALCRKAERIALDFCSIRSIITAH